MALSQEALGLPRCVTTSKGAAGAPGSQSQPPPGGGRPPAACQQTGTCGCCRPPGPSGSRWVLGRIPVRHWERPSPTSPARVWAPDLWNLPVWARPSRPRGLGGGTHPGREGLQGPWGRAGWNSEAGETQGRRRKAQRPSAGQTCPHAWLQAWARPAASGQRRAVGRRLLNASGSGRREKGNWWGPSRPGDPGGHTAHPGAFPRPLQGRARWGRVGYGLVLYESSPRCPPTPRGLPGLEPLTHRAHQVPTDACDLPSAAS